MLGNRWKLGIGVIVALVMQVPAMGDRGGPDEFGYVWVDSDETDGPTYAWVEVFADGISPGYGDDVSFGPIALGFTFNFYGVEYDSVRICTNGFLSFTSNSSSFINTSVPNPNEPNAMIAVMWDDLIMPDYAYNGLAYLADTLNDRFVVCWANTWPEPWYIVEAILSADGSVVLQYNYVYSAASYTIGIEDEDGTDGLQVAYDEDYLHNAMAVRFAVPPVTDLTISAFDDDILLRWTPTEAISYRIYGSTDGVEFSELLREVAAPPCTLSGELGNWMERCYMVTAVH